MTEQYLNLMEKTLSAYSTESILEYFERVKKGGLKEHGFPRLTANIGILIANGRKSEMLSLFLEMMELCCKSIPMVKAENDFSVREIISCIIELEKSELINKESIARWKDYLSKIEVKTCYNQYAEKPTDFVLNWGLFTCLSEYYREKIGIADTKEFVDVQILTQLRWLDENGMYKDNAGYDKHQPLAYDIVGRYLFTLLLFSGYRGKYYKTIDDSLRKAGLLTLKMQSVTGEIGFGGRSNQFLHNEATLAIILEYEAKRYKEEGDLILAGKFKSASIKALNVVNYWLSKNPITHIKNRYPIYSMFGCEEYAYFDKYMITTASMLYLAGSICDDSIMPVESEEKTMVFNTTSQFHKTFVLAGGYSLEFDTDAEPNQDACGLGRVHKKGAPSSICLSVPFPIGDYVVFGENKNARQFSICPTIKDENGKWLLGADSQTKFTLFDSNSDENSSSVTFRCKFINGKQADFTCLVDKNGVLITASSNSASEVGIALPIFEFDGQTHTKISYIEQGILIEYEGWICEYTIDGFEMIESFANRNGIYKGIITSSKEKALIKIKIYQKI